MGASKMMGERLVTAANDIRGARRTRMCAVRFGNVIGSRGSVVPIFARQLLRKEPVTITDPNMTRYVMTIAEAASLVLEAGAEMHGGEVFVTKMRALAVKDLASAMARQLAGGRYDVVNTGVRRGEKMYEELISVDEIGRTVDLARLLVVLPPSSPDATSTTSPILEAHYRDAVRVEKEWNSSKDALMSEDDIVAYMEAHKLLDVYLEPGAGLQ
jgi:FlaA1/EpsC-like NDP-sugar epimerase